MENSLEYHGEELQHFDIPLEFSTAVEHLILSYPNFTQVGELPLEKETDKVIFTYTLVHHYLLLPGLN